MVMKKIIKTNKRKKKKTSRKLRKLKYTERVQKKEGMNEVKLNEEDARDIEEE